jgi:single-stranded-DNA-specific exonuclease
LKKAFACGAAVGNLALMPAGTAVEWVLREHDEALLSAGAADAPGPVLLPLTRRLLALRGVSAGEAPAFLEPKLASLGDPFEIPGMDAAARRILGAVDRKEGVVLYGDYDVDGVSSLALMTIMLRAYGLAPKAFLPHRLEEGYGLSSEGLGRCFEEHGRPGLLIALDCGTCSVSEAAWLRAGGVDLVIVDHHEPGAELPDCEALVNPKAGTETTAYCTAGLVFKLMHALLKRRRVPGFDLREHLDLAALGTVADLVPLRGENRILVRKGLEKIAGSTRPGLRALKTVAGVDGHVEAHHIGYRLGPRLNASGRLDHAQASLDLLLTDDPAQAEAVAAQLNMLNRDRQEVENRVQVEAEAMIAADPSLAEAACIVLGSREWHPGVVGIVASRIMRDHHRPAIMIAFDESGTGKGSGRSVPGVSLVAALEDCRALLLRGGGHAMAVGLSLEERNLGAFQRAMQEAVERQLESDTLRPRIEVDAECALRELGADFQRQFTLLEPFGTGNPDPLFLLRGVEPQLPGVVLKDRHWKLRLRQGGVLFQAMWFNAPLGGAPAAPWDVVVKLQRQFWRGQESWTLLIAGARAAE